MTTLTAWVSYSDTGESPELPRAIYVASDSRITWGAHTRRWDAGRKIFCPLVEPHIFGYCGDVVFPSLVLGQIISAIDLQLLTASSAEAEERNAVIVDFIQSSHRRRRNVPEQDFIILHIYRSHVWPSTQYRVWTIGYSASENMWSCDEIELPTATAVVVTLGSGARTAKAYTTRWAASDAGGTSRAIFSAFCDALSSGEDRLSGGMPQLNALYTEGSPRPLGVVENNQLFLHGLPIKWSGALANIEWCDRLFNRLDPLTMKQASGARRFARPTNSGIR